VPAPAGSARHRAIINLNKESPRSAVRRRCACAQHLAPQRDSGLHDWLAPNRETGQVLDVPPSLHPLEIMMPTGTVKWFNPTKGYGFIQPQGGGKDVFVHISAVERAGLSSLNEGQQIEYEIVTNRGKSSAENLKVR
jgi:CspA family cold shock protein